MTKLMLIAYLLVMDPSGMAMTMKADGFEKLNDCREFIASVAHGFEETGYIVLASECRVEERAAGKREPTEQPKVGF